MLSQRSKKRDSQKLKKGMFFLTFLILLGIGFSIGCNSSTSNPSTPFAGSIPKTPTASPTGTVFTNTPTNSPTLAAGANTYTPTPTYAYTPVPFFSNSSTSASPRGMVISGTILTVAENEVTVGGIVTEMEEYTGAGVPPLNLYNCCPTGSGTGPNVGNLIETGCPPIQTPGATIVPFAPNTIVLNAVQGFVNPGGDVGAGAWSAVLDLNGSGANLYCGNIGSWNQPSNGVALNHTYMPFITNGYGGIPFNNPRGLAADTTGSGGSVYVADTGNGYVEQFSAWPGCPSQPLPIHRWNGSAGVSIGYDPSVPQAVTFTSPALVFKSPYAVACDATGNVWVGDNGYANSSICKFTSGATTITESWQGVTGCQVTGLAIDSANKYVYVADSGNHQIEIYNYTGTLLSVIGDPGPAAHEFAAFAPTSLAFANGYLYVGDVGNDFIDVFH